MIDTIMSGILTIAGTAIIGMFIRIEHRLTKVETTISFIKENIIRCQQPLEDPTK